MPGYKKNWRNDGCLILDSKLLKKQQFVSLLKIYNVQGRTKIAAGDKVSIQNKIRSLHITQQGIEDKEIELLVELDGYGERDDFQLDISFGDISSVIETDTDFCAGDVTETSAESIRIECDDTDELIHSTKTVSFDVNPQIRTIHSRRAKNSLLRQNRTTVAKSVAAKKSDVAKNGIANECASGNLCNMKQIQLNSFHKCQGCRKPMHGTLCAGKDNEDGNMWCLKCHPIEGGEHGGGVSCQSS